MNTVSRTLLAGLVGAAALLGGCNGSGEDSPKKVGVVASPLEACALDWAEW